MVGQKYNIYQIGKVVILTKHYGGTMVMFTKHYGGRMEGVWENVNISKQIITVLYGRCDVNK